MADDAEIDRQGQPTSTQLGDRLQNLRNLLRSERHSAIHSRAMETLDRELEEMSGRRIPPTAVELIRQADALVQSEGTGLDPEPRPIRRSSSELVRSRRRLYRRPSVRLRDQLLSSGNYDRPDPLTVSPFSPSLPNLDGQDASSDFEPRTDDQFRAKRRKLGDGMYDDGSGTFSYGHEGQVTPGKLRLEILQYDEENEDDRVQLYAIRNIFSEDQCHYLSKSCKMDILMKHVGGQPFTLESIVVKTPWQRSEWPAMGGLVFIAMEDDALVEKSAQFDPQYPPQRHRYHSRRWYRPSQDYLAPPRTALGSIDRSRYLRDPYSPQFRHTDNEALHRTPLVPGFQVTVSEDDADPAAPADSFWRPLSPNLDPASDPTYSWSQYAPQSLRRRAGITDPGTAEPRVSDGSDSESAGTPEPDPDTDFLAYHQSQLLRAERLRQERHDLELIAARVAGTHNERATDDLVPDHRSDPILGHDNNMNNPYHDRIWATSSKTIPRPATSSTSTSTSASLVPHAKFSLHQGRRSAKITFDPPVAGKYILLKLWSACPSAGVDIQQVTAYGYGGPRFFPAIEMR